MDLPGKEDVKNTYLSDDIKDQELICLNLKQEIKGSYHERAVKAACFMNPLFISLFPIIFNFSKPLGFHLRFQYCELSLPFLHFFFS